MALLALILPCGPALAAGASSSAQPYDIVVMVIASGSGDPQVALSYARPVSHRALRSGIEGLARGTGAKVSGVAIRDARVARGIAEKGTDAEFSAAGLIGEDGPLPVGPIIRSLPEWEHMRLVFALREDYPFAGPFDVTADGFGVRLVNRVATYEYDVERISKTGRAQDRSGVAGSLGSSGAGAAESLPSARGLSQQLLWAALIALPSGLLLGWLVYGWLARAGRRRREGAAAPRRPGGG